VYSFVCLTRDDTTTSDETREITLATTAILHQVLSTYDEQWNNESANFSTGVSRPDKTASYAIAGVALNGFVSFAAHWLAMMAKCRRVSLP